MPVYTPLDTAERQIRLLHLEPATSDREITCYFSITSVAQETDVRSSPEESEVIALYTIFEYEALSYVWGSVRDTKPITVEDQEVEVTVNLHTALRNLRHDDRERILWVDALCINQQDVAERNSQIIMMADIYNRAIRVLAYLGDYFSGCEVAVEIIEKLGGDEDMHLYSHMSPGLKLTNNRTRGRGFEDHDAPTALHRFLSSPWMTRVWTVQEFMMASQVVFLYGQFEMRSEVLHAAITRFSRHDAGCCNLRLHPPELTSQSSQLAIARHGLASLKLEWDMLCRQRTQLTSSMLTLEAFRHREATDQRDRVYGLLGLFGAGWKSLIRTDYSMKLEELYKQAALADMHTTGRLHFLNFCYMGSRLKMASWIPDWSTEWTPKGPGQTSKWQARHALHARMSLNMSLYSADGGRPASAELTLWNSLMIRGIAIGGVAECSSTIIRGMVPRLISQIRAMTRMDVAWAEDSYCGTPQSMRTAYLMTLVGGLRMGSGGTTAWKDPSDEDQTLLQAWERTLHERNRHEATERQHLLNLTFEHTSFDRRFATLDNGLFGWVPFKAQPNDCVVVLCGGSVPYVLRRVTGIKEEYTYIGDAYIHGMMNGEAFQQEPIRKTQHFVIV